VAGADGVVSKGTIGDDVVRAIRTLSHGRRVIPPIPRASHRSLSARLEPNDQAILGMLLQDIAPSEVADALGMSGARLESRRAAIVRTLTTVDWREPALDPAGAWA
jgi:DNA-binding NarL/FixJ family response regulator